MERQIRISAQGVLVEGILTFDATPEACINVRMVPPPQAIVTDATLACIAAVVRDNPDAAIPVACVFFDWRGNMKSWVGIGPNEAPTRSYFFARRRTMDKYGKPYRVDHHVVRQAGEILLGRPVVTA